MTTRREVLQAIGIAAAGVTGGTLKPMHFAAQTPAPGFAVPPLGYPTDAPEPYIDAQTMQIHHDRHHAAYVNNLNNAIASYPQVGQKPVMDMMRDLASIPEAIRTAVRNNAGGHINHSLFWQILAKNNGAKPKGALGTAIDKTFGSFEKFQEQFTRAAMGQFGRGWAWLSLDASKSLMIEATPNQDNPWMAGRQPVVGIDVWEHAYYLKYQNRRADYVAAFYNVINWEFVLDRYEKLLT